MKSWCFSCRLEPPTWVVSARDGSNVFFAAHSRALRQWYHVYPGGEKEIDAPQMILVTEEYVRQHPNDKFIEKPKIPHCRKKQAQLYLPLR